MIHKNKWDGIFEGEWKKGINYGGIRIIYGNLYTESFSERKIGRKAGRFCDAKGNEFGRIDNEGNFYDEKGNLKGKVIIDGWYDNDYNKKGKILFDGKIIDENNNIIGRYEKD